MTPITDRLHLEGPYKDGTFKLCGVYEHNSAEYWLSPEEAAALVAALTPTAEKNDDLTGREVREILDRLPAGAFRDRVAKMLGAEQNIRGEWFTQRDLHESGQDWGAASLPAVPGPQEGETPPQPIVDAAIGQALYSPCRSKRGSVVFVADPRTVSIYGRGHNRKPDGFECDGSAECKATCRVEAVHAEQKALLNAGPQARGADLLHVKVVDGELVPSGEPSCVQCSKLAVSAGITGVWLCHKSGWRRYSALEFHRLSLAYPSSPARAEGPTT